jgi:hypothetical protein
MSARKFLFRFLAIYAAAFLLAYLVPENIHRRDFDGAFSAWFHDRTPQNEAALRAEQRKNEKIKLADGGIIALALATVGSGLHSAFRFAHKRMVLRSEADVTLIR